MTWPAIPRPNNLQTALLQLSQHINAATNGCPSGAGGELSASDLSNIGDWDSFRAALINAINAIDQNKAVWGSLPHCQQHGTGIRQ